MSLPPTEADARRERIEAARQQLVAAAPERWEWTPGVPIVGELTRVSSAETAWGTSPILYLVDDDGVEHAVWLLQHKILREEIEAAAPQIGDVVAILFEGKKAGRGGGSPYNAFRVRVTPKAGVRIDWTGGVPQLAMPVAPEAVAAIAEAPADASPGPEPSSSSPSAAPAIGEPGGPCAHCGYDPPHHDRDCPADPPPY